MMLKFFLKLMEQQYHLRIHLTLKIHISGLNEKNKNKHKKSFKIILFRYPNQPGQAPPGQYHDEDGCANTLRSHRACRETQPHLNQDKLKKNYPNRQYVMVTVCPYAWRIV